jgi:pimeloyl-ACP methyl ester carboxylesterase
MHSIFSTFARPAAVFAAIVALSGCSQYATVRERRPKALPPAQGTGADTTAEAQIAKALRADDDKPLNTVGEYLDAAEIASRQLARNPNDAVARRDYNFALARVFMVLRDEEIPAWSKPLRVPGARGDWVLSARTQLAREAILGNVEFIPADQIVLSGTYVTKRMTKDGVGAPIVALVPDARRYFQNDQFGQGKNVYYGVTAVARFEGRNCVVSLEDPLKTESIVFEGHRLPLAADFTAPLALMLARENPKQFELARLLRPGKYAETARLARLQPYDPAKIPVLCVHGLMDSPATWTPLLNAMRGDPKIRDRYQFWFYSYPSGYPYPYSAAIMRKQMDAIDAFHRGHKKIVLIGHSMGGMISRLMITDSGDALWLKTFGKPPGEVHLSPETRKFAEDALLFRHRPNVARVIFIAAPHRGSDLASNWLGRIGSSLVKAPTTFLRMSREAVHVMQQRGPGELKLHRLPNSVDTLAPNNRFVKAVNTIPITPGIPYHTIVGDRGRGDTPNSSDGIVPYWSSHLDGAKSELIVPSHHSAHQNPKAIAEVRRILLLHADR